MKQPMTMQPSRHDKSLDTEAEPTAEEASLYADPFSGEGICKLAQTIDAEFRDAIVQYCPRCGRERDEIAAAEAPACILQGIDLDNLVLDGETGPLPPLPKRFRSKVKG